MSDVPRQPKRRLDSMVSVRLSAAECDLLRQAAERQGMTLSSFLRLVALRAAEDSSLAASRSVGTPAVVRWS